MMDRVLEKVQLLVDILFEHIPQAETGIESLDPVKVISHRGRGTWTRRGLLENTLPAFEKAMECGAWGVECDLRWTLDNVPVILHDSNTKRVFQKSLEVGEVPFEVLRQTIPQVPHLEEVLAALKGRAHLMLEIKEFLDSKQWAILKKILKDWVPQKEYHLMSLNPDILNQIKDFPSKALVSIAELKRKQILRQTLQKSWGGYTGHYLLTTNSMLRACQDSGINCGTGFVNSKNVLLREASRGVNWIFTDETDNIMKIITSQT